MPRRRISVVLTARLAASPLLATSDSRRNGRRNAVATAFFAMADAIFELASSYVVFVP
jgi:hypothetical protein